MMRTPPIALNPDLILIERPAECGGAGPEQNEDEREAGDEERRVDESHPSAVAHLGQGHARQKSDIRWNERKHARGEEAEQSRGKRDEEPETGRLAHNGASSLWRQSRQTP